MLDLDKSVSFYATALKGVVARQQVAAHNIANQDTPGYKTKEVHFAAVLSDAIDRGQDLGDVKFDVTEAEGLEMNNRGNNVHLEREWMQMEEAKLLHSMLTRAAGGVFRGQLAAIRGR